MLSQPIIVVVFQHYQKLIRASAVIRGLLFGEQIFRSNTPNRTLLVEPTASYTLNKEATERYANTKPVINFQEMSISDKNTIIKLLKQNLSNGQALNQLTKVNAVDQD